METKICKTCGLEKPIIEFNFKDKKRNKRQAVCKDCQRARERELYHTVYKYRNKDNYKSNRKKYREKITIFLNNLKECGCIICGESDPCCLDFHHLKDKEFDLAHSKEFSLDRIKKEIEKCIILCANCHRKLHANKIILPL